MAAAIACQAASAAIASGVMVGIALVQPIGKQPDRAEETIGKVIGKAMIAVIDIQNSARLEIDGADADASSGARLGGLEIHSGRTLRVRVPSLAPEDPRTHKGFVDPGSRISLEGSALLLPAIWSAHYFNYLDQIARISDQSDRTVRLTEPSGSMLPILSWRRGTL